MSPVAADLRALVAQLGLAAAVHRELAAEYRAAADAHDAVADALERDPCSTPIPDTLPAPPPEGAA